MWAAASPQTAWPGGRKLLPLRSGQVAFGERRREPKGILTNQGLLPKALVRGSAWGTDTPSPEPGSRDSVAVRHAEAGHRIENPTRELYLDSLAVFTSL